MKTSLNWLQVLQMAWKMFHSLFIKYLTEWDEIQNPHLPKIILFIRSISLILYPKIMLIVIKNLDELIVFNFSLVWIKPYTMKHLHRNTQCLFQEISIFLTGGFSVWPLTPQDFPIVQYSAQIHASEPTVGNLVISTKLKM